MLDPDNPEILEEARWWVKVDTERTRKARDRCTLSAETRVAANADTIGALTSGLPTPKLAAPGAINMQGLLDMVQNGGHFVQNCGLENTIQFNIIEYKKQFKTMFFKPNFQRTV